MKLERDNAELRARITHTEAAGITEGANTELLLNRLTTVTYELGGRTHSLMDLFPKLSNYIAAGTTASSLAIYRQAHEYRSRELERTDRRLQSC